MPLPSHRDIRFGALLGAFILATVTGVASAQTGAALLQQPWEDEDTRAELSVGAYAHGEADIDDTDDELDLMRYESQGRYRPSTTEGEMEGEMEGEAASEDQWQFGYDLLHLDLDTSDPALPERLVDVSLGGAWTRDLGQGRSVGANVGLGYAGDAPFGEGDAVYLIANVAYDQPLDRQSKLTFTLNYNGNRTIWPDVPLPLIAYTRRMNDQWTYTLGLPFSSIRWRPTERWTISAVYAPVYTFDIHAEYRLSETWRLFGQYENDHNAFVVDGDEDRRLFFQQRRLEVGARYLPNEHAEVLFAVGYAFDQEFDRGWDVRDTDTVRDVDDTPFVRAEFGVTF